MDFESISLAARIHYHMHTGFEVLADFIYARSRQAIHLWIARDITHLLLLPSISKG